MSAFCPIMISTCTTLFHLSHMACVHVHGHVQMGVHTSRPVVTSSCTMLFHSRRIVFITALSRSARVLRACMHTFVQGHVCMHVCVRWHCACVRGTCIHMRVCACLGCLVSCMWPSSRRRTVVLTASDTDTSSSACVHANAHACARTHVHLPAWISGRTLVHTYTQMCIRKYVCAYVRACNDV